MKQKIILSLNNAELEVFRELVKNSNLEDLNKLVNLVVQKDDPDSFIKRKVYEALSDLSGFGIDFIKESHKLKSDLGLTNYHKKSLKTYFQRIVKELDSDKIVSVTECEKLEKVTECLELVKSKI
jgi:hypothetical protein